MFFDNVKPSTIYDSNIHYEYRSTTADFQKDNKNPELNQFTSDINADSGFPCENQTNFDLSESGIVKSETVIVCPSEKKSFPLKISFSSHDTIDGDDIWEIAANGFDVTKMFSPQSDNRTLSNQRNESDDDVWDIAAKTFRTSGTCSTDPTDDLCHLSSHHITKQNVIGSADSNDNIWDIAVNELYSPELNDILNQSGKGNLDDINHHVVNYS